MAKILSQDEVDRLLRRMGGKPRNRKFPVCWILAGLYRIRRMIERARGIRWPGPGPSNS